MHFCLVLAALSGLAGLFLGAFGAHALRDAVQGALGLSVQLGAVAIEEHLVRDRFQRAQLRAVRAGDHANRR